MATLIAGEKIQDLLLAPPESFNDMDEGEQERTALWLATVEVELVDRIEEMKTAVKGAVEGEKLGFLSLLVKLEGARTLHAAAMESLQSSSLVMRPPDQAVILKTHALSTQLAGKIAAARKAQALVKLVDDFALIVNRVLT